MNKRGPRREPWGTPAFKAIREDSDAWITTFCFLLFR